MKTLSLLCSFMLISTAVSQAAVITANANANFVGGSARDLSGGTTIQLRNAFGTANDDYGFLRFAIDATADTIGGVAVGDITAVTLDLYVTSDNTNDNNIDVWTLNDLADPGIGYESETSWANNNIDVTTSPLGDISSGQTPGSSANASATTIGGLPDEGVIGYTGTTVQIALDLTSFQNFITASTNDEITFIIAGPRNADINVASLSNTNGFTVPQLTITAIPEPSSFALVGIALAGLMVFRRKNS